MIRITTTQNGLETIFHQRDGAVIGYRIGGGQAGPRAVAVGRRADVGDAFHRLAQIPTLPRLAGELVLAFEDEIDDPLSGLCRDTLFQPPVDGSVYFAFGDFRDMGPAALRRQRERQGQEVYWTVLRLATRLGMISGRGVRRDIPRPQPATRPGLKPTWSGNVERAYA